MGYLVLAALCCACSTLHYMFSDHVNADLWRQSDDVGILCSISATSVSFPLSSFKDCPIEKRLHVVAIVSVSKACLFCPLNTSLQDFIRCRARFSIYVLPGGVALSP
jgi:predicted membrane channel-forming protein YqfA (hemolysin III family)